MTISQRIICLTGLVFLGSLLAGCAGSRSGVEIKSPWSSATYVRDFSLSRVAQTDSSSGITLIRIRPDGAVTIRVGRSKHILIARPGGYYICDEFGQRGLQLISSSPSTGTATFQQSGAE